MADDDEPKRRSRGSGSFWNRDRVIIAIVFVIGLIAGIALANQFIDPALGSGMVVQYDSLSEKNAALDEQADSYYTCLQKQKIDPTTCEKVK